MSLTEQEEFLFPSTTLATTTGLITLRNVRSALVAPRATAQPVTVHIGYLPKGHVIPANDLLMFIYSVSKVVVDQEELTHTLVTALDDRLSPVGIAVVTEADVRIETLTTHFTSPPIISMSEMRGAFLEYPSWREEFYVTLRR